MRSPEFGQVERTFLGEWDTTKMARLTLQPSKKKSAAHRVAQSEGESAVRLLQEHGYPSKRRANGQSEHSCPAHEEPGTPKRGQTKFYVDIESSQFQCHSASCGFSGNLVTLERHFGVDPEYSASEYQTREQKLKKYEEALQEDAELREVFHEDGINDETLRRFRIGWDDEGERYVIPYLDGKTPVCFRFYNPEPSEYFDKDGNKRKQLKYYWETGATAILYNFNDASGDDKGRVILCEGEKKAMALAQIGYNAVATPGAGMFKDEWHQYFTDAREIVICFDNDNPEHPGNQREIGKCKPCLKAGLEECRGHNPGQDAAHKVENILGWRSRNVVLPLPDRQTKKTDVNEYFVRDGHTAAEFAEFVFNEKAEPYKVQTLDQIMEDPPDEVAMLVEHGILPKGGRLLVAGRPKAGKAESVDTLLPMADGSHKRMGDIEVGDRLIGRNGRATEVVQIHPQGRVALFKVVFGDGSSTICSGDHLWNIANKNYERRDEWRTVSTLDLKGTLESAAESARYYIPMVAPVEYEREVTYEIDPYVVGAMIGDGGFTHQPGFTTGDDDLKDLFDALKPEWMTTNWFHKGGAWRTWLGGGLTRFHLERLGLLGHKSREKFIPPEYLVGGIDERMSLLRGLMDTDGGMNGNSACFYTTSTRLRDGVRDLVGSLGGVVNETHKASTDSYTLSIRLPEELGCPFALQRKVDRWSENKRKRRPMRRIAEVVQVQDSEAQCVTVDAEDSLYCSDGFIITHNSIFVENLALSIASGIPFLGKFDISDPSRVLLLDRELSRSSLYQRLTELIKNRPGYRVGAENLAIDHDHLIKIDRKGAYDVLERLVTYNGADVVIFDTAYKFFASSMDSASSMTSAFEVLDKLIHETGVSVVMTHHQKKKQGNRQKTDSGGDMADPEDVAGSFLWTGWPNASILLNFMGNSVENPFNSVATFTAFRDAAPPEPLALYRDRDSISYSAIRPVSPETAVRTMQEKTKPSTEAVMQWLFEQTPIPRAEAEQGLSDHFFVSPSVVRPYLIDALATEYFVTKGKSEIIHYYEDEPESWDDERQLRLVKGEAGNDLNKF